MANSSFTQEQLTALETALAQGTLKVKYSDKEVTYRSLTEMRELRNLMRRELGLARGSAATYPSFSKGLG